MDLKNIYLSGVETKLIEQKNENRDVQWFNNVDELFESMQQL